MRGGVVVSSGGAAFRDPRLFDRNKFTSLVTTVGTATGSADGGRGGAAGGAGRRPRGREARQHAAAGARPRPARMAPRSLSKSLSPCSPFFFLLILALVYKIYITRCS